MVATTYPASNCEKSSNNIAKEKEYGKTTDQTNESLHLVAECNLLNRLFTEILQNLFFNLFPPVIKFSSKACLFELPDLTFRENNMKETHSAQYRCQQANEQCVPCFEFVLKTSHKKIETDEEDGEG